MGRANFLRTKESNMREIVGKAYTELGRELTEARDRLASHDKYSGVFEKWYTSMGFKRAKVYDLINRYDLLRLSEDISTQELIENLPVTLTYELVVTNCDSGDLLEDLPVSLTYDIAKPSAESTPEKAQAKAEVLAGEIESLKEYRERIKELECKSEQAEKQAEAERKERERLEQA